MSVLTAPLPRAGDPTDERERWTRDPRPDRANDGDLWAALLTIAFDGDSADRDGCFGCLHAVRCMGAGLVPDPVTGYRLTPGELSEVEYSQLREAWLKPRREPILVLMQQLDQMVLSRVRDTGLPADHE